MHIASIGIDLGKTTHPINRIEELLPWNLAARMSSANQTAA
jgi:hypothetical protein